MKRYIKSNTFSNMMPIMAGTRYDKQASKILSDSGLFDLGTSEKIIDALFREDIHAFVHSPNWLEKYLKGIARMIVEESHGSVDTAQNFLASCPMIFDQYLSYVKELRDKLGGADYDKKFINEMHYEDVENAIQEFAENYESDEVGNSDNTSISGYTLVPIDSYEQMHSMFGGHLTGDGSSDKYAGGGGTAWCHTNDRGTYNYWTKNGEKFFVLMADNFQDIEFDSNSNFENPKDEYGNSLIAIRVDRQGRLINATLRCNHVGVPSNADNQYRTYEQLSSLSGLDVESIVKENLNTDNDTDVSSGKYELTDETIDYKGRTLYRIRALIDFGRVHAGDLGGFIESYANLWLDGDCWVGDNAKVYGNGYVCDNAQILGIAEIFEHAVVSGNVQIRDNAHVYGRTFIEDDANVYGNASIHGCAQVHGNCLVCGFAQVFGYAKIYGEAEVSGNSKVYDNAWVFGGSQVYGDALILGNAWVSGNAQVYGRAQVSEDAQIYGNAKVFGDAWVSGFAQVYGDARVGGHAYVYGDSEVCGHTQLGGNDEYVSGIIEE